MTCCINCNHPRKGGRTITYRDCPKCGSENSFECYQSLSSLTKMDTCLNCWYMIRYKITNKDGSIKITRGRITKGNMVK